MNEITLTMDRFLELIEYERELHKLQEQLNQEKD